MSNDEEFEMYFARIERDTGVSCQIIGRLAARVALVQMDCQCDGEDCGHVLVFDLDELQRRQARLERPALKVVGG